MSKVRVLFGCQACGFESSKWLGRCPDCGEWNSFAEERREEAPAPGRGRPATLPLDLQSRPKAYDLIDGAEEARTPSGIDEFDRVLGGGIVPGSMVLIGGEPGIGKSTLLLQALGSKMRLLVSTSLILAWAMPALTATNETVWVAPICVPSPLLSQSENSKS
jgi:predicted ATP-dependent serine protease